MNKIFVAIPVSLLFCTVHNSNSMNDNSSLTNNLRQLNHPTLSRPSKFRTKLNSHRVRVRLDNSKIKAPPTPNKPVKPKKMQSDLAKRKIIKYSKNLAIAAGIKIATYLAKKSILKDLIAGKILDEAATINVSVRILLNKYEKNLKYLTENIGSYSTSVAVLTAGHKLSKTSAGKKIEKLFDGKFKPIKEPCKYLIKTLLTGLLWTRISNLDLLSKFAVE